MLRRLVIVMLVALFAVGEVAPSLSLAQDVAQAQVKKRRTLFDFLFGNDDDEEEQQAAPPPQRPVVTKPRKAALPPPPKPEVSKAPNAVRLAVFGDSLAVDLADALDRFYAEDPNIVVIDQAVASSGFVRADYFDWNKTAAQQVAANSFDIAVVIMGINDRQNLKAEGQSLKPLTPEWTSVYQARVQQFVSTIRSANKPVVWIGLPPMSKADFSAAMSQISATQRLAAFAGGGVFVDIYDRFVDEDGNYTSYGPDLTGNRVRMRKSDGIHFSAAGADKLAFYASQSIKLYYRGGAGLGIDVADALAGTDAAAMVRPPYQGLGQNRLLEVAGAVVSLTHSVKRADDLVTASATPPAANENAGFDLEQLVDAPRGRADDFGVGHDPAQPEQQAPEAGRLTVVGTR
jgi:hypothetical protein